MTSMPSVEETKCTRLVFGARSFIMNRRRWIQSGCLALAACGRQSLSSQKVKAGPFSVLVPTEWMEGTRVQKVPAQPLYTREGWDAFQQNPMHALKPGYACRPMHWSIQFPRLSLPNEPFDFATAGDDPTAPQILIHEAQGWASVSNDGIHRSRDDAWTSSGMSQDLAKACAESEHFPKNPGFHDGSLDFLCLKKTIRFIGGRGVRMLGQIMVEADLMCRGGLHYLFLGMSDDHSCQIIATFPVDLEGLPSSDYSVDKKHLGWSLEPYGAFTRQMDAYSKEAVAWLQAREDLIVPSLKSLDKMLQSLVVRTWG